MESNSTCFGQFLCPSSGVFHCTHNKTVWHIPLLCVQWKTPDNGQRNCPKHVEFDSKNKLKISASCWFHYKKLSWSAVNWTSRTPADGQRNCPKHVEFHSKNKFKGSEHVVCCIIKIYHDARSLECQINLIQIYFTTLGTGSFRWSYRFAELN